jgi:nucleoside-diphosphate-sugar epimerase
MSDAKFIMRTHQPLRFCILITSFFGLNASPWGVASWSFTNRHVNCQPKKAFVVTGSNGYLGRAVVHELLNELHVNENIENNQRNRENTLILCLVRSQHVVVEEKYWNDLDPSTSCSILVFPYDMLDNGKGLEIALSRISFLFSIGDSSPIDNKASISVFHIASVFGPTENHTQTALDNVRGTVDLVTCLGRFEKGRFHKKLIVTSSMAAVRGTGQTPVNGQYYTADDWNTMSKLGTNWGSSYQWSKAEAERQAWKLCQLYNISMVAMCPSFVFGPPYGDRTSSSYSIELVGQWIRGESQVQSRLYVDIRDVAKAHVKAAFEEAAIGKRYIVSTEARIPSQQIALWLCDVCRSTGLVDPNSIQHDAEFTGGSIPIGTKEVESLELLRNDLEVLLRPVNETILDMAQFLLKKRTD